jgi:hypothetical protein
MSTPNNNIPRDEQFNEKRRTSYNVESSQTTDHTGLGDKEAGKAPEQKEESAADINRKYENRGQNDLYAGSDTAEARDSDEPYDEQPMDGRRAFGRADEDEI